MSLDNSNNQNTPTNNIVIQSATPFAIGIGLNAVNTALTGTYNTAVGYESQQSNTSSGSNTSCGYATLQGTAGTDNTGFGVFSLRNTQGTQNTGFGYSTITNNGLGYPNVGIGAFAVRSVTSGTQNVGIGYSSMMNIASGNNTVGIGSLSAPAAGSNNVAVGYSTLGGSRSNNVAIGSMALAVNLGAIYGTAIGANALAATTSGQNLTAVGANAMAGFSSGNGNTAIGASSLGSLLTGTNNTICGYNSGTAYTGGESNNLLIGANIAGVAGESNQIRLGNSSIAACYIAGIYSFSATPGSTVILNTSNNQFSSGSSTGRVKENIYPLEDDAERFLSLRPVVFNYKSDAAKAIQFGLIAEEVEKVYPELALYDREGIVESVQYHVLPSLLLHHVQKLERDLGAMQKTQEEQRSDLTRLEALLA